MAKRAMFERVAVAVLILLNLTAMCPVREAPPPTTTTNTLVLIADDLGCAYVGIYDEGAGYAQPPTPNIDALANEGVVFDAAYACTTCTPSRISLFTGRFPFRSRDQSGFPIGDPILTTATNLSLGETLLPELLGETAMIGKWHMGHAEDDWPVQSGFDFYQGTLGGTGDYFLWQRTTADGTTTTNETLETYNPTQTTDDAIQWITARQESGWALFVSYRLPHKPFHAPPAALHTHTLPLADNQDQFEAMVEALDTEIGRLLSEVPGATNVIFVGDNGSVPSVCQYPACKWTLGEGGIRVPLIISGPAVKQGLYGYESEALVQLVDLFPTILSWHGSTAPPGLDGLDLNPILAGQVAEVRDWAFAEKFTNGGPPLQYEVYCVRDDRYKLIRMITTQGSNENLYDLLGQPDGYDGPPLTPGTLPYQQSTYSQLVATLSGLRPYTLGSP